VLNDNVSLIEPTVIETEKILNGFDSIIKGWFKCFSLKTWVVTVFFALDFRGISDKDIDGC